LCQINFSIAACLSEADFPERISPRKFHGSPPFIFYINQAASMNDTKSLPSLPDRLSVNPSSPHYKEDIFEHDIGIKLNGKERNDVNEYCISEGWIKIASPKALDRKGQPLLIKMKGTVEAFYK
jgi:hypothetical protein